MPKSHIIGKVNQGFKYIMHNFNHERLGIVMQANRLARVCIEEALKVMKAVDESKLTISL